MTKSAENQSHQQGQMANSQPKVENNSKSLTKSTATPWHIEEHRAWHVYSKGQHVALMNYIDEAKANAELICLAVNAFQPMVEALRHLVEFARREEWDKALTGRQLLLRDAEAALKLAGGL